MSLQKTADVPKKDKFSLRAYLESEWNRRKENTSVLFMDIVHIALGCIFARAHVAFGAYALGIALAAALSRRVPLTLFGTVIGALSLGPGGVVYALSSVITVLLRVVVSGTSPEGCALFGERRSLRACSAVIGAFICSVYEVLLDGVTLTTVLYAAVMIAAAGVGAYVFSCIEHLPVSAKAYVLGTAPVFSSKRNPLTGRERIECEIAQAAYVFCIPYALRSAELFGISAAYVFGAAAVIFFAKRFGPLRGMAAGFLSALGLSTTQAVAFALGGLCAGLLFPLGTAYALIGAAATVGAWGALADGLLGFVTAFPEFAIAAALSAPLCRRLSVEVGGKKAAAAAQSAADMVGTMALAHRSRPSEESVRLETALASLTAVLRSHLPAFSELRAEDAHRLLRQTAQTCRALSPIGGFEVADAARQSIVQKVMAGETLDEGDFSAYSEDAQVRQQLLEAFRLRLATEQADRQHSGEPLSADVCEIFAKMINEVRIREERENALDADLSRRLTDIMVEHGFAEAVVRAYGDRRKYILAAASDPDGEAITDSDLFAALENACDGKLRAPSFFRKDAMVLMESTTDRRFAVESAAAGAPRREGDVSGDSVAVFCDSDGVQYAVVSDGMGTGADAERASALTTSYLSCMMGAGCTEGTAMYLLNRLLRAGGECSATVDLFSFDTVRGEGQFYKSGAAPSYLKRGNSLFRIRSQTAPVGLLRTLDAERIKVDVHVGDIVIMLSDGISASAEDDPWLLELLSRPAPADLQAYADRILAAAKAQVGLRDDMTVLVARICAAPADTSGAKNTRHKSA